jgi:hypothetical protein
VIAEKKFAQVLAQIADTENGEKLVAWLREQVVLDSYDPMNPHNTSRNEGRRSAYRELLDWIALGKDPNSFQTTAITED